MRTAEPEEGGVGTAVAATENGQADKSLVDEILEDFVPESDTFVISIPRPPDVDEKGDLVLSDKPERTMTFRTVDHSGIQQLKSDAADWWENINNLDDGVKKQQGFDELIPKSRRSAMTAFTIHWYSAEPTKLSIKDALRMLKAGWLVEYIVKQIDVHNRTIGTLLESNAVAAAKKDSSATLGE